MLLSIVSALEQKNLTIDWLEVNTNQGNYVIERAHVPTVLVLTPESKILYRASGASEVETLTIKQAIVHVTRTDVTILVTHL